MDDMKKVYCISKEDVEFPEYTDTQTEPVEPRIWTLPTIEGVTASWKALEERLCNKGKCHAQTPRQRAKKKAKNRKKRRMK